MSPADGFVLLYKPSGITSFAALQTLKRRLATGKVGHTGTLDRFAEGLLVVLCGALTRFAPMVSEGEKEYEAVIRFGKETETLDPEGAVIGEGPIPSAEKIRAALPAFIGTITQVPPAYSAVHIDGMRAHAVARRGEQPRLAPRETTIREILVRSYEPPDLFVTVTCSKGTYIRSLARDLGLACGTRAYVERLKRTRVGSFVAERAVTPDRFDPRQDLLTASELVDSLTAMAKAVVNADSEFLVRTGGVLDDACLAAAPERNGPVALFDSRGAFLALVEKQGSRYRYEFVSAR